MNTHDHYIQMASKLADQYRHRYITTEHLLLALLSDADVQQFCEANQLDLVALKRELTSFVEEYTAKFERSEIATLGATATNSVGRSKRNAITLFYDKSCALSLFFGILNEGTCWASYLIRKHGKNVSCLRVQLGRHAPTQAHRRGVPRGAFSYLSP
jgi:ATP-dependent Clp protease ATP-binding subunit ClpA